MAAGRMSMVWRGDGAMYALSDACYGQAFD